MSDTGVITKKQPNKFFAFVKRHKKLSIFVVLVIILAIVIVSINLQPKTAYDYSLAYDTYSKRSEGDVSQEEKITYSDGIIPSDVKNYQSKAYQVKSGNKVSYEVQLAQSGSYTLSVDNYILHNGFHDSEFTVVINGETVLSRVKIRAKWLTSNSSFAVDSYGNEIVPSQIKNTSWQSSKLYDYSFSTPLPYDFTLKSGTNSVEFDFTNSGDILIGNLQVKSPQEVISYEDYVTAVSDKKIGKRQTDIQGEKYAYKNDTKPIPTYSADVNAYPYDTDSSKLNTIDSFNSSAQIITYDIDVDESALYSLTVNGAVSNSNHTTFTTVFIDGKVPFGELQHFPLSYSSNLTDYVLKSKNDEPFAFYLTSGKHELSFKIDQSLYSDSLTFLSESIEELNSIYLNLKRIAGTVDDQNREWNPETDFPGVVDKLEKILSGLEETKEKIYSINGARVDFQATIYLTTAINSLKGILKKTKYIPNKYSSFSEGSSSLIQNLASAKEDLQTTPFTIDRILVGASNDSHVMEKKSGWFSFTEQVKKFFSSFFRNYSMTSNDEKVIQVWVARSRQYVDLMQQVMDESDFEEKNGYQVKFTLLSDEGKLILSNAAGVSPNAVMGISNWLPYEMGIRGLTVDLTKYEDYGNVISRFSKGSMINLISDNIGLGLPETQDFYVTYYRKDILNSYGLSLPSTWDDVINLLPKLQRNGMNFYIPLSTSTASKSIMTTAPFIFQYGGNLFSEDGTKTTIDEEDSLNAIKMMTNLYTLYGMETQVSSFFDSFRNGSLPIGVSTFDMYVKLSIAAPEISDKWGIALSPGVKKSDGSISRYQTGSSTAMALLPSGNDNKDKAGWELLKWWSGADIQENFASKLSLLYGKGYIWNSANIDAFDNSIIFTDEQKNTILDQWKYLREIPKVPGWYMLERELSNSWNNIVLNGENTRSVISNAVTVINKELKKKLTEFGYLDSAGNTIKEYHMTTFDTVDYYLNK